MNKKTLIAVLLILFVEAMLVCQQRLSTTDFYYSNNGLTMKLGDSLLEKDKKITGMQYINCKLGNREYKVFEYYWGKVYIPSKSETFKIFGIEIDKMEGVIYGGIKVGSKKEYVYSVLGNPYYEIDNNFLYYNEDFDVLELKISFDQEDNISKIRLFMGT